MNIITYRKVFFAISGILLALSVAAVLIYGFRLGTDFRGGSILELSYPAGRPEGTAITQGLDAEEIGSYSLRPSGEDRFVLRSRELSPDEKDRVVAVMSGGGESVVERFNTVGPVAGTELARKSVIALALVILAIVLFITYAFRKVSEPVQSWKYGLATILALAHDVIIPTGIYVFLGQYMNLEIDLLFVTALLAILGYSVHDTIVVFDRIRENLSKNQECRRNEGFSETVGRSVSETFTRSINTSVTLFLVLGALYFLGSETTKAFSLILLLGAIVGTYSSICIASPLLVTFSKMGKGDSAQA
jgi:preprotein translocase subunit SecF